MRLERLNSDKIKIFLTFDDLDERGITKDEIWQDIPKVHQLFRDMMSEADDELGFKAEGSIAVEVFSLPAQGMVVIVTKGENCIELEEDDDYIEMQVTLDESDEIFYEFVSFEDIIAFSARVHSLGLTAGTMYSYQQQFYLKLDGENFNDVEYDTYIALLSEFGSPSTMTTYRVQEYGKVLMEANALGQLYNVFVDR